MLQDYYLKLNKIIKLSFELTKMDDKITNQYEEEVYKIYANKCISRIDFCLNQQDKNSLTNLLESEMPIQDKYLKMNNIIKGKVNEDDIANIMLDELEKIAKAFVSFTSQSLNEEAKQKYVQTVDYILK